MRVVYRNGLHNMSTRQNISTVASQSNTLFSIQAERGPGCIFVKLTNDSSGQLCDQNRIFESIADAMQNHFVSRVVVDVDELETVPANICDQMDELTDWVSERGGLIRFAGESVAFEREMHARHPDLHLFVTRESALLGGRAR